MALVPSNLDPCDSNFDFQFRKTLNAAIVVS